MPVFNYRCSEGHESRRLLVSSKDPPGPCPECGGTLIRTPTGPNSTKMEVLDNGAMRKRIERPSDAERLVKERAIKHSKENEETR